MLIKYLHFEASNKNTEIEVRLVGSRLSQYICYNELKKIGINICGSSDNYFFFLKVEEIPTFKKKIVSLYKKILDEEMKYMNLIKELNEIFIDSDIIDKRNKRK